MEGKGSVMFKRFADIDSIDLEIDSKMMLKKLLTLLKILRPSFGGINLEDIAAPDCFMIEQKLKESIRYTCFSWRPTWNSNYHYCSFNKCFRYSVVNQLIEIKVVVNGAGASAQACANLFKNSQELKVKI